MYRDVSPIEFCVELEGVYVIYVVVVDVKRVLVCGKRFACSVLKCSWHAVPKIIESMPNWIEVLKVIKIVRVAR